MSYIKNNVKDVFKKIEMAAFSSGRDPGEIALMAVTKGVAVDRIRESVDLGVSDLGENRIQEASGKIPELSDIKGIKWHMIGHLQTNKVKTAVSLFDSIHSLDTSRLARKINAESADAGKVLPVYIEVNVSGEKSKYGVAPSELGVLLNDAGGLLNIRVEGLMTMAPFSSDPEDSRPYFKELARLAYGHGLKGLCMGMSNDFTVAIEEGATIIRVGRAIFQEKP